MPRQALSTSPASGVVGGGSGKNKGIRCLYAGVFTPPPPSMDACLQLGDTAVLALPDKLWGLIYGAQTREYSYEEDIPKFLAVWRKTSNSWRGDGRHAVAG